MPLNITYSAKQILPILLQNKSTLIHFSCSRYGKPEPSDAETRFFGTTSPRSVRRCRRQERISHFQRAAAWPEIKSSNETESEIISPSKFRFEEFCPHLPVGDSGTHTTQLKDIFQKQLVKKTEVCTLSSNVYLNNHKI